MLGRNGVAGGRRPVVRLAVYQLNFYEPWDNVPALLDYLHATLPAALPIEAWEVGMSQHGGFDQQGDQQQRAGEPAKVASLLLAGGARRVVWLPLAAPRIRASSASACSTPAGASGRRGGEAPGRGFRGCHLAGCRLRRGQRGRVRQGEQDHPGVVERAGCDRAGNRPVWRQRFDAHRRVGPVGKAGLHLGSEPFVVSVPLTLDEAARLIH